MRSLPKNHNNKNEEIPDSLISHLNKYGGIIQVDAKDSFIAKYEFNRTKIKLRKSPSSDLDVYDQIFGSSDYGPLIAYIKSKKLRNDSQGLNIIDAGANIGLTSIYFSQYFSNSKFVLIEPDIDNYKILKWNIKNNIKRDFYLINCGIWRKCCHLEIVKDFRDCRDWSIRVKETDSSTAKLKGLTISTIMDLVNFKHIDILKIDIEGSEKVIFTTDNSDLNFLLKTKFIAMEIHDEFDCRDEIYRCLKMYGFEFFNKGELTIGSNHSFIND